MERMYDCVRVFLEKHKMLKLKLLPSLKEKKRYLVYEASGPVDHKIIVDQCNEFLGIFEAAKAGLQPITHEGNRGIIRVTTKYVDKLKTCLMLIKEQQKKPVRLHTMYVSGLLRKAKQKLNG